MKGEKMLGMTLAISLIVLACFCIFISGLEEGKSKKKKSKIWLLTGIICLVIGMFFFYYGSCRSEMRRRLNEPVFSEEQLYGYKILNVESPYDDSEEIKYFINIEDTIPPSKGILRNVEIAEKFFYKIGYLYPSTEPNDPPGNYRF